MNLKTIAGLACAGAALTACASGPLDRPRADEPLRALMSADVMMFVSFDADGDLNVSTAELEAGMAREFARADTNGDGSLQPLEFQNWANVVLGGGQLGPYRLDFDRNVDNVITREEYETEIRARFTDYDEDENGSVSRTEFIRLIGLTRPPSRREPVTQPYGPPPRG